jgi:hypothetical protein
MVHLVLPRLVRTDTAGQLGALCRGTWDATNRKPSSDVASGGKVLSKSNPEGNRQNDGST